MGTHCKVPQGPGCSQCIDRYRLIPASNPSEVNVCAEDPRVYLFIYLILLAVILGSLLGIIAWLAFKTLKKKRLQKKADKVKGPGASQYISRLQKASIENLKNVRKPKELEDNPDLDNIPSTKRDILKKEEKTDEDLENESQGPSRKFNGRLKSKLGNYLQEVQNELASPAIPFSTTRPKSQRNTVKAAVPVESSEDNNIIPEVAESQRPSILVDTGHEPVHPFEPVENPPAPKSQPVNLVLKIPQTLERLKQSSSDFDFDDSSSIQKEIADFGIKPVDQSQNVDKTSLSNRKFMIPLQGGGLRNISPNPLKSSLKIKPSNNNS